jgi:TRAP-type C4-dicarboxylate transport system substrate-binding protein
MKKKCIMLTFVLVLCLGLFAACGGSSSDSSGGDTSGDADSSADAETPADDGTVYEFAVINHDAATSMGQLYVETLFNQISEDSGGRLVLNYFPGGSLFGATEAIDAVQDGSADICWSTSAFFSGVFPISEFINLPVNGITSARMCTDVLHDMIAEIPECAAEYDNWYTVANHGCAWSPISTIKKKIEKPSDFQGMQIRAAGTVPSMYLNALGATAVSMPTSDVYEALSKGVVDGMANDWHNIDCFNLFEVVDYCLNTPVNNTACFVLMNKEKYESLPDDLKALIDKYSKSGFASDMAGYWWDSTNFWVGEKMLENGVEIYEPTQEVYDFMYSDEMRDQVHQTYIDYLDTFGLDGQAVYDKLTEIVSRYSEQYADAFAVPFHYNDWDMSSVEGYKGYQG